MPLSKTMKLILSLLIFLFFDWQFVFASEKCNSGTVSFSISEDENSCRFEFRRKVTIRFRCKEGDLCTHLDIPEGTTVEIE